MNSVEFSAYVNVNIPAKSSKFISEATLDQQVLEHKEEMKTKVEMMFFFRRRKEGFKTIYRI